MNWTRYFTDPFKFEETWYCPRCNTETQRVFSATPFVGPVCPCVWDGKSLVKLSLLVEKEVMTWQGCAKKMNIPLGVAKMIGVYVGSHRGQDYYKRPSAVVRGLVKVILYTPPDPREKGLVFMLLQLLSVYLGTMASVGMLVGWTKLIDYLRSSGANSYVMLITPIVVMSGSVVLFLVTNWWKWG